MNITRFLFVVSTTIIIFLAGCETRETDIDIKNNIETKLKAEPGMSAPMVDVRNGIVTIEGQCSDEACKANCEKIAQQVTGVKTVISNLTVAGAPAEVPVAVPDSAAPAIVAYPEDLLTKSVADAVKKFPTVIADTKDSIVILTGSIAKASLPKLMKSLSSLKPKKIENKLTVIKNSKEKRQKPKKRTRRRR